MRIDGFTRRAINNVICDTKQFDTYWDKPGAAITRIAEVLENNGITLPLVSFDDTQAEYHCNYMPYVDCCEVNNAMLSFRWYRMASGRYEIIAYVT